MKALQSIIAAACLVILWLLLQPPEPAEQPAEKTTEYDSVRAIYLGPMTYHGIEGRMYFVADRDTTGGE